MNYILAAFLAATGTYLMTASGAASVFLFKNINTKILNMMLGFSSGIMLAASYFSLLAPALDYASEPRWLALVLGFSSGFLLLILADIFFKRIQKKKGECSSLKKRTFMLISSITLHNIPEGLVVGVAFGALTGQTLTLENILPPLTVAMGIGLQNFPEGAAVSLPLRRDGFSPLKSFFYGQLSGMVEPVSALLGALLVGFFTPVLPYALSFAAGAMVLVVIKELIPEEEKQGGYAPALGCMLGFTLMMALDIALS